MNNPQEILLPARQAFIYFSLGLALLLNFFPWQDSGWYWHPDFLSLTILYWSAYQPRKIGMGLPWILGLIIDVGYGTVLGQYAITYALLAFYGIYTHRRMALFNPFEQMLQIIPPLLAARGLLFLLGRMFGGHWAGPMFIPGVTLEIFLWPLTVILLQMPQRPRTDNDT